MVELIIPAFIAGFLTFLAPCTLPLVPAYLGFISGATAKDLEDHTKFSGIRRRVMLNGLFYVLGFSIIFIVLGVLFGVGGSMLVKYQFILLRIGGIFVVIFSLYLLGVFQRIPTLQRWLTTERRFHPGSSLKPGTPHSSFIFGATFAFGWTPCVGPIMGSVLLLASTTATVGQGAFLLAVFSIGLAIPFLLMAWGIGQASQTVKTLSCVLPYVSIVGGVFLLFLGILLITDNLGIWLIWFYRVFDFLPYDLLLDYL